MSCNAGSISSRWLSNSVAEILTRFSLLQFTVGAKQVSVHKATIHLSLHALIMCLIDVPEELMGLLSQTTIIVHIGWHDLELGTLERDQRLPSSAGP